MIAHQLNSLIEDARQRHPEGQHRICLGRGAMHDYVAEGLEVDAEVTCAEDIPPQHIQVITRLPAEVHQA